MSPLFGRPLSVINAGLASFAEPIAAGGATVTQLDWAPPGDGDPDLARALARLVGRPSVAAANARAFAAYDGARPVLEGIAAHPGASNRLVGDCAEIADPGQISKLLARLERVGLLVNTGGGHARGEPNAWRLTPRGERVARNIRGRAPHAREAA